MSRVAILVCLAAAACGKTPRASGNDGDAPKARSANDPSPTDPPVSDKRAKIHLSGTSGDVVISAEVVSSPATITRGLMYREHLPTDEGMLFLMGFEDDHVFWMHNTLIPLDLVYIGADMKVAGIYAKATPRTDERRSIGRPSLYVLEVNGGWCAAHGVVTGTAVRFDGVEAAAH